MCSELHKDWLEYWLGEKGWMEMLFVCRWFPRRASKVALVVKNLPTNAGDARDSGSIPESGRSPGIGSNNPFQYSCLDNSMDREPWQVAVRELQESDTTWRYLSFFVFSGKNK